MKLYKNIISLTMRAGAVYRKLKYMNQTEREFQKIKTTNLKDKYVVFFTQKTRLLDYQ